MRSNLCDGCQTRYVFARRTSLGKWLCDTCWGHLYAENTCSECQQGAYDEDLVENCSSLDNVPEGTWRLTELARYIREHPDKEIYICRACIGKTAKCTT